jgi:hypothetical protein
MIISRFCLGGIGVAPAGFDLLYTGVGGLDIIGPF